GDAWDQLKRAFGRDAFEAVDVPGLIERAGDVARDWHPRIKLVVEPMNAPEELHAPLLIFARFVTQRLEGDRDLDDVAVRGDAALRFHHDVGAVIFALPFRIDTVRLHAQRIEE